MCVLLSLVLSFALVTSAKAAAPMAETCGAHPDSSSATLHLALGNVLSFGYVHHAFEEIAREYPRAEYCVSGVPLSRNAYQYYQYYIQVNVRAQAGGPVVESVRLLYQDASVQAYHNTQGQPWVALSPADVDAIFGALVKASSPVPNAASQWRNPVDVAFATNTFRSLASQLDASSLAVLAVPGLENVTLVTALTQPSANPYAGTVRPFGVLVGNGTTIAENVSLSTGLLFPLENRLSTMAATAGPKESWSAHLVEISRVNAR